MQLHPSLLLPAHIVTHMVVKKSSRKTFKKRSKNMDTNCVRFYSMSTYTSAIFGKESLDIHWKRMVFIETCFQTAKLSKSTRTDQNWLMVGALKSLLLRWNYRNNAIGESHLASQHRREPHEWKSTYISVARRQLIDLG